MDHLTTQLKQYISSNSSNNNIIKKRKKALAEFIKYGFPKTNLENYRFTNLSKLNKLKFFLPNHTIKNEFNTKIEDDIQFPTLYFLNGRFLEKLSKVPDFISIESILNKEENFQSPFGVKYDASANPFVYLNTALINDGFLIKITESINEPLRIIYKMTAGSENLMNHPKFIIKASKNINATIIEEYHGENALYFNNICTDFTLGVNSHIKHYRIQNESSKSYHIANTNYNISKDASIQSTYIVSGSNLHRHDINVILNGEGGHIDLNGLCLLKNSQHIDHNIIFDHAKEYVTSKMLFKYILSEKSTGVFNGRALVREDSQKIDSIQTNNNLILSNSAIMNSNPQLEIYADDVKCTHGSTTGQLDENALFYIRSRGLDLLEAKSLLINGFANEIINEISNKKIKEYCTDFLENWLGKLN